LYHAASERAQREEIAMMDSITQANWENLRSQDGDLRFAALNSMLAATDQPDDRATYSEKARTDFQTRSSALSIPGFAERLVCVKPRSRARPRRDRLEARLPIIRGEKRC
jgi:hypothetical protein